MSILAVAKRKEMKNKREKKTCLINWVWRSDVGVERRSSENQGVQDVRESMLGLLTSVSKNSLKKKEKGSYVFRVINQKSWQA